MPNANRTVLYSKSNAVVQWESAALKHCSQQIDRRIRRIQLNALRLVTRGAEYSSSDFSRYPCDKHGGCAGAGLGRAELAEGRRRGSVLAHAQATRYGVPAYCLRTACSSVLKGFPLLLNGAVMIRDDAQVFEL